MIACTARYRWFAGSAAEEVHLYVHVPFCSRRCSYCDFSIAVRRDVPATEYVQGVAREMEIRSLGNVALETVYFGGGTPSKLGPQIADLMAEIRARFAVSIDAEVTVEANPEDVSAPNLEGWRAAGVNRLSIGAQSFDDNVLAWMHRTHAATDTDEAVRRARDAGIANISLDLIFALPEFLRRDLGRDLEHVVELAPEHVSVYGLTVEPHTPLGRWTARGDVSETPEEKWAAEFLQAHETLSRAGFWHYEVSNYAREARRARHNSAYWRDRPYVGLGPAAHGYDGYTRRWNESAYARWLERVQRGEDPVDASESLTAEQRLSERIYVGLRTSEGLPIIPEEEEAVRPWVESGWAEVNERHASRILSLTVAGWMRLDALAAALTSFRSR